MWFNMKIKYLIMVSLILTILTMGIVSATEDVNASDTLTINDQAEEETVLQQDLDVQAESVDESRAVEGEEDSPVDIDIYDKVWIDDGYGDLMRIIDDDYLDGTVKVVVDDNDSITKVFKASKKEIIGYFGIDELKKKPTFGSHKINVTYQKNGVSTPFNKVKMQEFTYTFRWAYDNLPEDYDIIYGGKMNVFLVLPYGSNGTVNFKFNSKNYTFPIENGEGMLAISVKGLKVGNYNLEAEFRDAANYYPVRTINLPIRIVPDVIYLSDMAVGDKDIISITAHKNSKITATLYKIGKNDKKTQVAKVSGKTKVSIPLEKLIVKGFNKMYLKCTVDGFNYESEIYISGWTNQKNVKSSITKKGDKVTLNLKGPKTKEEFGIYLDGNFLKTVKATKGKVKYVFSNLSVGKHRIHIAHYEGYTYHKTFVVTVKAKDKVSLTFKKVDVKKSAKKLVLKATLKLNKKAKKGLKVTFKFNGKKYVAKTNKKGVAKVTIKKKVLKKLKVGKKVKYQASYGKIIAKKTAKIKK